jgi:hypothetical protein
MQLNEQMDFARILYNKGFYLQSLKMLEKSKEQALSYQQFTYLQQILFFEKKIEALYVTRSMQQKADELRLQSKEVNEKLLAISQLSGLSLQLYGWYIKNGLARNNKDEAEVKAFLERELPPDAGKQKGFYEELYYAQSMNWYAFIRQDFPQHYRYSKKWVEVFDRYPVMIEVETAHYIKGLHNLMASYFDLQKAKELADTIDVFEKFSKRKFIQQHDIYKILCFQYLYQSKINLHFLEGSFSEGIRMVPQLEERLNLYESFLDRHRVLVFYYKIACLYFGSGHFEKAIQYLNKIIHWRTDLRNDLQCYARLLHLIAHYELGHLDLLEYLIKSVYRFMAKMENLSGVEEAMFQFLRRSFSLRPRELNPAFKSLLKDVRKYESDRFESRAFIYLDIISWLESKISGKAVQEVIRSKYEKRNK